LGHDIHSSILLSGSKYQTESTKPIIRCSEYQTNKGTLLRFSACSRWRTDLRGCYFFPRFARSIFQIRITCTKRINQGASTKRRKKWGEDQTNLRLAVPASRKR